MRRCVNCMKVIGEDVPCCPHCGYGQKEKQSPFEIRQETILHGRYLTGRTLGQGGFGLTYVGYDLTLDIRVAIKEYFPSGFVTRNNTVSNQVQWNSAQINGEQWRAGCESFLKEARRMAKIDSLPGIVRVRDTFPENQTAYIVMDYIEGETLKQKQQKTGPMEFTQCIRLLSPFMKSLGRMHSQGMIHRDISPDNIMIQPDGSVCLLDFGAAKDISFQQTAVSQQVAKKGFSPPEQYREKGNIGPWTDVYALCATICYCVTGRLIPDAMERMYADEIEFGMTPTGPLSVAAADTLRDGLKLRAEERIQTVAELLARLDGTALGAAQFATGNVSAVPPQFADGNVSAVPPQFADGNASAVPPLPVPVNASVAQEGGSGENGIRRFGIAVAVVLGVLVLAVAATVVFSGEKSTETVELPVQQPEESVVREALSETVSSEKTVSASKPQLSSPPVFDNAAGEASNILMKDASGQLNEDNIYYGTVLGSQIAREDIAAVTFLDTLDQMPVTAPDRHADVEDMVGMSWDVSWAQDGGVMAWIEESDIGDDLYDLYIASEGGVKGQDCEELFAGYLCAGTINFNDCFDTSQAVSMSGMFLECTNLKKLDISDFDTGRVTDMALMFCLCTSLEQLDLGDMNTGAVTRMDLMFAGCGSLEVLNVSGFDVKNLESCEAMFEGCAITARQAGFAAAEEYILPESGSRYLSESDLQGLSKEECRIARNEIFARHGRKFDDEELQEYFNSCSWYTGTIAPEDFDDSVLNEYEIANRDLIVTYEQEKGYR